MSRDYGKVRSQFWDDDALRGLSIEANYLALYLITSRHTNAIGCFRLPIAYILNDTRLDKKALERALAELRSVGYALPCERVPWIYIPNFLRHNPPENPNVWRKCVKELDALPGGITAADNIASELIALAGEERMSKEGSRNRVSDEEIDRLQRYRNGIETVSEGLIAPHDTVSEGLTPLPYPIPIPIPNQSLPKDAPRKRAASPPQGDPEGFEDFYTAYPRKAARPDAVKAYREALARGSPEEILAGAKRYAAEKRGEEPKFIKLPAGWLRTDRWKDSESGQVIRPTAFNSPEEVENQRKLKEAAYGKA